MSAQFVVGIDLGTTHSVLAAARIEEPRVHLLPVPQVVAPGETSERVLLPSFLYLPGATEYTDDERRLPWGAPPHIVGEYARKQGAKDPNRLVASAKSWICHGGVNRRAAILPWSAPDALPHVSPYEAQVAVLAHLASTWHARHRDAPLAEQDVVVTVPASFDEGARVLTSEAAAAAGLGQVRLIEEPQAAFYDYQGSLGEAQSPSGRAARERLARARLVLVLDVGGGTTDLTLLRVAPDAEIDGAGLPRIERIAVGGHLMLGGDNMDAALAFFALQKAGLEQPSDATVWSRLVQSARDTKERLLAADAPESAVVSYQARGSSLLGNTKSIVITKQEATRVLLDGCFPLTGPEDIAARTGRVGLTTLGLPYTSDTAVPRHVCAFLRRHATAAAEAGASVQGGLPRPDLLLLNGGVFQAPALVARLLEVLGGWYQGNAPELLEHTSLDTSVARGAVRYGLSLRGIGSVITGGTAKAYYVGIEHEGRPKALCVAPRNVDPGTRSAVPDRLFQLRVNEPVIFPLFTYTGDRVDAPGTLLDVATNADELEPLAPLETLVRGQTAKVREVTVSVRIESSVDETGSLRVALATVELPPRRWTLEFAAHKSSAAAPAPLAGEPIVGTNAAAPSATSSEPPAPPHPAASKAVRDLEVAFSSADEGAVLALRGALEAKLGPRGEWSLATCRVLADACLGAERQRGRSAAHELNWLRLLSWTMRPGIGASGDGGRVDALWGLEPAGPVQPNKANWTEWWITWRRVAPGLDASRQLALFERVQKWLWPEGRASGAQLQGPVEAMRMVAALELLPATAKTLAGTRFLEQVKKLGSYWPLGRVGARRPLQGTAANVVPRAQAEAWLEKLFELDWEKADGAAFAAASLARVTGDPVLDVSTALRDEVAERLTRISGNATWIDMVLRETHLDANEVKRVLGDSLPAGLRLD